MNPGRDHVLEPGPLAGRDPSGLPVPDLVRLEPDPGRAALNVCTPVEGMVDPVSRDDGALDRDEIEYGAERMRDLRVLNREIPALVGLVDLLRSRIGLDLSLSDEAGRQPRTEMFVQEAMWSTFPPPAPPAMVRFRSAM